MENKLDLAIYNRFKNRDTIVAELKTTSEKRRRWIAVYQPKSEPAEESQPPHVFSILDFELEVEKIDEYFSDEDMINQRRYYVNTEDELFKLLESLEVKLSMFTYPWKCDYPL